MDPIGSVRPDPRPTPAQDKRIEQVAEQLESHFLSSMLQQMHGQSKGMLDGGFSGSMYQGMLDEKLADSLSASSPLGLRDMLVRELSAQTTADGERGGLQALSGFTKISSGYGMRTHPISGEQKFHHGWDLPAPTGTPVNAVQVGTVTFSGSMSGYGEVVKVAHPDGSESLYAHLSKRDAAVGERVGVGTKIGEVGETGAATGPHLHFEVLRGGKSVDPGSWLTTRPPASTSAAEAKAPSGEGATL